MFTSRAEYRLVLRADNADLRLTQRGLDIGCVGPERAAFFARRRRAVDDGLALARRLTVTPDAASRHGLSVNRDGRHRNVLDLLAMPGASVGDLAAIWPELGGLAGHVREQIEIEGRYAGYLGRMEADVAAFRRDEALALPEGFDYREVGGLSNELLEKLESARPGTLGQAGRISGMTPAALSALLVHVRRRAA
jgi:tRNA uridine 5-carboxymethylaminomethyl modification enzyme